MTSIPQLGHSTSWFGTKGVFTEMALLNDVVVKARVIEHKAFFQVYGDSLLIMPNVFKVELLQVYKGKTDSVLLEFEGSGSMSSSGVFAWTFKIGREYYLSYNYKGFGLNDEKSIFCVGENFLEVDDEMVVNDSEWYDFYNTWSCSAKTMESRIKRRLNVCLNASFEPEDNLSDVLVSSNCKPR